MKFPVLICLICAILYASETIYTEKKLGQVNSMVLTFFSGIGIAVLAGLFLLINPPSSEDDRFPRGSEWGWLILVVVLFFLADYTHFVSVKSAGAVLLCTTYLLIPVIASIAQGQMPSWKLMIAWVLAGIALILLATEDKPEGPLP